MELRDWRATSRSYMRATPETHRVPLEKHLRVGSIVLTTLLLLASPIAVFADKASDVAALEAQCEQEREARIKPLREAEIAKCKAVGRNDPAYCERFWRDYGNASRRPDGTMTPRLFHDLPSCIAAFKARKALNREGSYVK